MNKIRTAIFGGTFDPVHLGHTALASEVCNKGFADEVWFMVSPQNPHKAGLLLTPEEERLRMVQLAVADDCRFRACDFEFSLPRPSYTISTLSALEQAFPERDFILLIGADNWAVFHKWHRWQEILSRYKIVVYPRGNEQQPPLPDCVTWMPAPLLDVSSTQVRALLSAGDDVSRLLNAAVLEYIKEKKLYKNNR